MASLRSLIDAPMKEPTATARLNGSRARDVLSIEVSSSINDALSNSSLVFLNKPNVKPESKVQVYQGYNKQEVLTFTGYVDIVEFNENDNVWTVQARDVLKKAMDTYLVQEVKFGIDPEKGKYYYSTYSSDEGGTFKVHEYDSLSALNAAHPETVDNYSNEGVFAHAVVQWLLVMCGFSESTEIRVDDTNFWIGDLSPAKFHLTSVYDAIGQIANLIGWHVYADVAGIVHFRKRPRNPSAYTAWKYTSRTSPYNVLKIGRQETNQDLRNYVEVRGASGIKTVVRGSSPYIGNTPYRGVLISDELIDTPGIADFIANRVFKDLNRLKVAVSLEAEGNPLVRPGDTLELRSLEANGKFLVETVQTSMSAQDGYHMQVSLAQYPGDPSDGDEPPPTIEALFVATSVVSIGDPTYLVELDGSSSYSTRGQIVEYTWDFPDGTRKVDESPRVWWAVKDVVLDAGCDLSLTVRDEMGQVDTLVSGVSTATLLSGQRIKFRHLYAALTTRAAGSLDGGNLWTEQSIPAISVAASNFAPGGLTPASGHALFGGSDGQIYRTIDGCVTVSGAFSTGSSVCSMHIPETNNTLALAGCVDGKLYQSLDYGMTWKLLHTFSAPIRDVRYAYENYTYILVVCSGVNNVFESFDSGATFTKRAYGIDATKETSGSASNYFAHTSGFVVLSGGSTVSIPFEGAGGVYVTAATTMIDRDDGNMLVDGNGQHWVYSGASFHATQNNAANLTNHMIRDGEIPIVTYYATQSGVSKSLDRNETIAELYYPVGTMPTGGWGAMVAYGPLTAPVTPGRLLLWSEPPTNSLPAGILGAARIWVASSTSDSWIYVRDTGGLTLTDASVTPGHWIAPDGGNDKNLISMIRITASGSVESLYSWFNMNDWLENADQHIATNIEALEFSKIPARFGDVHVVINDANGLSYIQNHNAYRFGTITNFVARPSGAFVLRGHLAIGGGIRTHEPFSSRLALNDSIYMEFSEGLLDNAYYDLNINFNDGTVILKSIGGGDSDQKFDIVDRDAKFTPTWHVLARYNPFYEGLPFESYTGYGLLESWDISGVTDTPELSDRSSWLVKRTEASYEFADSLYYCSSGTLNRIDRYGQGTSQVVFTPPVGHVVFEFSVTPGPGLRTDCIAVMHAAITEEDSDPDIKYCSYSTDAGETWIAGPSIPMQNAFPARIWYVSETSVT